MKFYNSKIENIVQRFAGVTSIALIVALAGITQPQVSKAQLFPGGMQLMDLTDIPLFLQGSAPPAIALSMDTSPDTRNAYIFNHDALLEVLSGQNNLPNAKEFLSAYQINKTYYQPDYEYQIPIDHNGVEFNSGNQTKFRSAYEDGFETTNTVNLECEYRVVRKFNSNGTQDYSGDAASCDNPRNGPRVHAYYSEWVPILVTRPNGDPILDENGNQQFIQIEDATADQVLDDSNYRRVDIFDDPATPFDDFQNFAIWYSYYKSRNMLVRSAATIAFHELANHGRGVKLAWQSFKSNEAFETPMYPLVTSHPEAGNHKKAFWDWLFGLRPNGSSKLIAATHEAGLIFKQPQTYWPHGIGAPGDELSCQQNFHVLLAGARDIGNSPNISLTEDETLDVPALGGVNYSLDSEGAIYTNSDETDGFADFAYHYWANDLMPNLDDEVPRFMNEALGVYDANGDYIDLDIAGLDPWDLSTTNNLLAKKIFWNNFNDPANWQHMVNFVISLGIPGLRDIEDAEDYASLRAGGDDAGWDDPDSRGGNSIRLGDALQHGAVNSRGEFILAYTPQELIDAFTTVIQRLLSRRTGSSAASSVSANIVTEETKVYKTGFDARGWAGSVVAQSINFEGEIGGVQWDAGCILTGGPCGALGGAYVPQALEPEERKIFMSTGDGLREFTASNLTSWQTLHLSQSPQLQNFEASIEDLVAFLRGDRNLEKNFVEGVETGVFRKRRSLLGDVIHSTARVVRGPSESYIDDAFPNDSNIIEDDNLYRDFKVAYRDRQNVLLVGANDGMLHAFDANTGVELWAFIPARAFRNLHMLADPDYEHQNYVDAAPVVRDVYINGAWKTVAIGGMRLGGQAFYALDITNPTSPQLLWEFSDRNNPEIGFSYGEPFITRLPDDRWVALLPNGYNNIIADGFVGSGRSAMIMVDVATGNEIKTFYGEPGDTKPNGMAAAAVSDIPYDITGDAAFFGDYRGNIYRVDLTDPSFPMETFVEPEHPFDTPITTAIRLTQFQNFSNDTTDVIVNFGAGKYIETTDKTDFLPYDQFVAGIFDQGPDYNSYPIDLSDSRIVRQEIVAEIERRERLVSAFPVVKGENLGWLLPFPNIEGERVIAKMATRASAHFLILSTYLPNAGSLCSSGGASWVYVLDNRTGGQPVSGPVLLGGRADGMMVENQVFGVTPIGFAGGGGEILIISTDSDSSCDGDNCDASIVIPDFTWRRRSWHRMFQDE